MTPALSSPHPTPASSPPLDSQRQLAAFLDYLQAECGLSSNTRKAYARDLRYFLTFIAAEGRVRNLADLSVRHVEAFGRD